MLTRRSRSTRFLRSCLPTRAWRRSGRAAAILVLFVTSLALMSTAAEADTNDAASGSGEIAAAQWSHCPDQSTPSFEFAAAGTGDTSATGTFRFSCSQSPTYPVLSFTGPVQCLVLSGSTALIGGTIAETNHPAFSVGEMLHWRAFDGVAGDDRISNLYSQLCTFEVPVDAQVSGSVSVSKAPQCSDGRDNDGDGFTDYPDDPGCTSAADDTESPNPPPPTQCNDTTDNDGDGLTDYPDDPGCTSAADDTESPDPSNAPTCEGRRATVYVANGRIVGGPDSGQPYAGTLRGSAASDVINGTTAADAIQAGAGADVVCALGGADQVSGEGEADRLIGGAGNDNLSGGSGSDTLQGRSGNDTITGGDGADRFVGGPGTDIATDYNRAQGDTRTTIP